MNRGSEWRRWELHLHTPFTKKADQYIGKTTDEKWDNFYTSICDYIGWKRSFAFNLRYSNYRLSFNR